ncbi:MAG: ABC transporter permease subunit [Rhodospirillaceae bacterium]|nr:ABC transporter permease subunit [Rhodospirillaceae bacterium]
MAQGTPENGVANGHSHHHVAFWRDERKRGLAAQLVVILAILAFGWYLIANLLANQERLGIPLGLDFLENVAGFQLSFAVLPVTLESPIGRLLVVGGLNTLVAAFFSAIIATFVGLLIGIMRLSHNWLISRIAATYIEIIRNIPLLLQLVFWYGGVLVTLPRPRDSLSAFDLVYLNIKGLFMPRPVPEPGAGIVLIAFVAAIGIAIGVARWARQRQMATGQQFATVPVNFAIVIGLPTFAYLLLGRPIAWDVPQPGAFNFTGGVTILPEMTALIIGLGLSTAAYVAEIVRSGINSVSHGQTEAALALGLKPRWCMRLVILPQALRVMIPPMISQYLNVVKNSTLAGFIGYPDLFSIIGTSQNQTGRAVECVMILMLFYLSVSLIISVIMNWYNKRVMLVER